MRRSDKEITDIATIEAIIRESLVCRLALCGVNGPYVVPVCFGYVGGSVYLHCAGEGLKLDILRTNREVCVEFEAGVELIPAAQACGWGMRYRSVIGFGVASILDDMEAKRKACDAIMEHYATSQYEYSDRSLDQIVIIKVELSQMTGKKSGY